MIRARRKKLALFAHRNVRAATLGLDHPLVFFCCATIAGAIVQLQILAISDARSTLAVVELGMLKLVQITAPARQSQRVTLAPPRVRLAPYQLDSLWFATSTAITLQVLVNMLTPSANPWEQNRLSSAMLALYCVASGTSVTNIELVGQYLE
jgi:hypothetical protein